MKPRPATKLKDSRFACVLRLAELIEGVEHVGELVRAIRGTSSQEEFAAAVGVVQSSVGKIERGQAMPSLALLKRIVAAEMGDER
jgi:DNA-binding transcriptional regulator YiaG